MQYTNNPGNHCFTNTSFILTITIFKWSPPTDILSDTDIYFDIIWNYIWHISYIDILSGILTEVLSRWMCESIRRPQPTTETTSMAGGYSQQWIPFLIEIPMTVMTGPQNEEIQYETMISDLAISMYFICETKQQK